MVYVILGIFVVICILVYLIYSMVKKRDEGKTEHDFLDYIYKNPKNSSMYVIKNGIPIIEYQANQRMPLASTIKLLISIEYAKQVIEGKLENEQQIQIKELHRYYIPNSDGNAHPSWLKSLEIYPNSDRNTVSLLDVVKGMIHYSSNANMEFLIEYLGLEQINNTVRSLRLSGHDPIFPISSANLIAMYIKHTEGWNLKKLLQKINQMSYEDYMQKSIEIHKLLKNADNKDLINYLNKKDNYDFKLQYIKSLKQPHATAKYYASLMREIHDGQMFAPEVQVILRQIIDRPPNIGSKFEYLGHKGGSSISILNEALYCKDRQGNTIELCLFIHEPKRIELIWLEKKLDLFLFKFLNHPTFQNKVIEQLMV